MKIKKLKKKIESKIGSDITIEEVDYTPGYWLNQETNEWIVKRIYVSTSDDTKLEQLEGIIESLKKSFKTNVQIILK
ncbi:MAG: hypothetical protein SLAVMIC_00405 [uncultured marine phage]|uniref:Uncharacterized protein n=1 Tax=uncultured marine phage TaxID=707152 RepID=A0A8D9FRI4_9VIRU|nr:MAG: hypothetical protein SLAVMIC_00405 [uncultured marine phage]